MKQNKKLTSFVCAMMISMSANAAQARINFAELIPPSYPNYYLACPKDFCRHAKVERVMHVYDMSADKLGALWRDVVHKQPRIIDVVEDPATGYFQYIQKSSMFQLPSEVTIQVVAVGPDASTFAIYSRSVYGYYDFNANSYRVYAWLKEFDKKVADLAPKPSL